MVARRAVHSRVFVGNNIMYRVFESLISMMLRTFSVLGLQRRCLRLMSCKSPDRRLTKKDLRWNIQKTSHNTSRTSELEATSTYRSSKLLHPPTLHVPLSRALFGSCHKHTTKASMMSGGRTRVDAIPDTPEIKALFVFKS